MSLCAELELPADVKSVDAKAAGASGANAKAADTKAAGAKAAGASTPGAQAAVVKDPKKGQIHPSKLSAAALDTYFTGLFAIADANGDGVLQPKELKRLLELCGFVLSAQQIAQFVSEADTNGDGVIEYKEFVPVATKMLQSSDSTKAQSEQLQKAESKAERPAPEKTQAGTMASLVKFGGEVKADVVSQVLPHHCTVPPSQSLRLDICVNLSHCTRNPFNIMWHYLYSFLRLNSLAHLMFHYSKVSKHFGPPPHHVIVPL